MHSRHSSVATTAAGRAAAFAKFLEQIPTDLPEQERLRRAEHLRAEHMARLAFKSVAARAKKKNNPQPA